MSEQGWRAFLAADGVDDWIVLHGGATAVFRVDSLAHAVRLAATIAETPGLDADTVVLMVTAGSLGVRLTRDMWLLEPAHWMKDLDDAKTLQHAMHVDVSVARSVRPIDCSPPRSGRSAARGSAGPAKSLVSR